MAEEKIVPVLCGASGGWRSPAHETLVPEVSGKESGRSGVAESEPKLEAMSTRKDASQGKGGTKGGEIVETGA